MLTIKIFKNNILTNQASFRTQELADTWLNEQLENKSFGELGSFQVKVEYS